MDCCICKVVKQTYACDGCSGKFCKQCAKLTSSEVKCLELKERRVMLFNCNECKERSSIKLFKDIIEEKNKLLASQDKVIELLEHKISKLEKQLTQPTETYSEKVQKNKEAVVVIKPKDTKQQSNITKEAVQDKINPQSVGTSVSKLKYIKNGGVAISCDERGVQKIRQEAEQKLGEEYKIDVLEKPNPKVKILNVNKKDISEEKDFIDKIIFHNYIDQNKENFILKVIKTKDCKKNARNCHIMIEVDPETYKEICRSDYIQTGWKGCRYEDYVNIIQCYRCWKFGHIANMCRSEKNICPICAGEHKSTECKSQVKCCVNCTYACNVLKVSNLTCSHAAYDPQCESYKRVYNDIKDRINFPQILHKSTTK